MINNCEYIVGGFVKKNILTNIKTNSLQERMTTLYPVIGQVLSIKNVLNTKKDKSIYNYLSFVYEDFNPLSNYPIQDTDYDEELANDLKQLESNNSINVRAINNINNYEELIELEFLSNLHQNLSDIRNNYDISDFDVLYNGKHIIYNGDNLFVDKNIANNSAINSILSEIRSNITDINNTLFLRSEDVLEYYLTEKETSTHFKQLNNTLLDIIDKISNPFVIFNTDLFDDKVAGSYSLGRNEIELSKLNKNVFLHELVHGCTLGVIYKSEFNLDLSTNESKFINSITDLYNKAVDYNNTYNNKEYYYGLKNLQEFVADGLSDVEFQKFLSGISLENNQGNVFTKFIESVKKLITGYSEDTTNTVLSKLINDTMDYIINNPVVNMDIINLHQDYKSLVATNKLILDVANISKNPYSISVNNYEDISITDNTTGKVFAIKYYINSDIWKNFYNLYEKNNNEIYPEILFDFIDYLKNKRGRLRQRLYSVVEPNDKEAMKHVLDKLKTADKEYFDELSRYMSNNKDIINVYDNTLKEEYDLTINPDEGTKISYCK